MSHRGINFDRVLELAAAICDERASPGDRVELNSIMLADPTARCCYLDYCRIHVALRLELWANRATQSVHQQITFESVAPPPSKSNVVEVETSSPAPTFLSTPLHGTAGWFSSGWPVAYLVATVIFGIGLLIGSLVPVSSPQQIAKQSSLPAAQQQFQPEPKIEFVGRITGMVDCQLDQRSGISCLKTQGPRPKTLVSLGDTFALASGLMEITYDTGAKVILQGPVTYEVESKDGGFLSIGKLTARVEKTNDECGMMNDELRTGRNGIHHSSFIPHPLFAVRTPTAIVTDLGTEFGVRVLEDGETRGSRIARVGRNRIRERWNPGAP